MRIFLYSLLMFSFTLFAQNVNKNISDLNLYIKKSKETSSFILDYVRANYIFSEKIDFFNQNISGIDVSPLKFDQGIKELVNNEFGRILDSISPVEIKGMQTVFELSPLNYKVAEPEIEIEYKNIGPGEIEISGYLKTNKVEFNTESVVINNYSPGIILEKIGDRIHIKNPEDLTPIDDIFGLIKPKLNKPLLVIQGDSAMRAKVVIHAKLFSKSEIKLSLKEFKIESIFDIAPADFKIDDFISINLSEDSGLIGFVGIQAGGHSVDFKSSGFFSGIETHKSLIGEVLSDVLLKSLNEDKFREDLQVDLGNQDLGSFHVNYVANIGMDYKLDNINYLKSDNHEMLHIGLGISEESKNLKVNKTQLLKEFDKNSKFNSIAILSIESINNYLKSIEKDLASYLELEKEMISFGENGVKVYVKDGKLFCVSDIIYKEKFFKKILYGVATGKFKFRVPAIIEIDFVYSPEKNKIVLKVVDVIKDRKILEKSTEQYLTNLNKGWLKKQVHKEIVAGLNRLDDYIFYELNINEKKSFNPKNFKVKYNENEIIFFINLDKEDATYHTLIDQLIY